MATTIKNKYKRNAPIISERLPEQGIAGTDEQPLKKRAAANCMNLQQ